jgi:hypothetical protein
MLFIIHGQGPGLVVEGGTARLECEARGEPSPVVFWQRENSRELITVLDRKDGKRHQLVRVDGPILELNKVASSSRWMALSWSSTR